jgi:AraC-like DNA-binding protein
MQIDRRLRPFFFSYAIGLVVPIVLGGVLFVRTSGLARAAGESKLFYVVEQTGVGLESIYDDIQFVVAQAGLDDAIVDLAHTDYDRGPDLYRRLLKAEFDPAVSAVVSLSRYIREFYLVLPRSGTVLGSVGTYTFNSFYEYQFAISDMTASRFLSALANRSYQLEWRTAGVKEGALGEQAAVDQLLVLDSYRPLSGRVGLFLFLLDDREIDHELSAIDMSRGGAVLISDRSGRVIYSTYRPGERFQLESGAGIPDSVSAPLPFVGDYEEYRIDSPEGLLQFTVLLSRDNLRSRVAYVRRTTLLTVVVLLFIDVLVVWILSWRSARPIQAVLRAIQNEFDERAASTSSGLEYVKDTVDRLLNKTHSLQEELDRQRPAMESLILEGVVSGSPMRTEELDVLARRAGVDFSSRYLCCFVLAINPRHRRGAEDVYTEFIVKKMIITEVLSRAIEGRLRFLLRGHERLVVIHGADAQDPDEYYRRVVRQLRDAHDELEKALGMEVAVGVGTPYETLAKAHLSYEEAAVAVDRSSAGTGETVLEYRALADADVGYYYPMELELKLLNSVRAGAPDDVSRVVEEIRRRNFVDRSPRPAMTTLLFSEVKGSIAKLDLSLASAGTQSSPRVTELLDQVFAPEDWPRFFEEAGVVLVELSEVFARTARRRTGLSKQELADYVNRNFDDPNLTLTSVAERFGVNEKYLSRFFKEQFHINFHAYVENLRLRLALDAIVEGDRPLKEVVSLSGYSSPATFTRAFKKRYGVTPSAYRERHSRKP